MPFLRTPFKQVCEEVHSSVRYRDMAGQKCKYVPIEHWLDWETEVTRRLTDVMTNGVKQQHKAPVLRDWFYSPNS